MSNESRTLTCFAFEASWCTQVPSAVSDLLIDLPSASRSRSSAAAAAAERGAWVADVVADVAAGLQRGDDDADVADVDDVDDSEPIDDAVLVEARGVNGDEAAGEKGVEREFEVFKACDDDVRGEERLIKSEGPISACSDPARSMKRMVGPTTPSAVGIRRAVEDPPVRAVEDPPVREGMVTETIAWLRLLRGFMAEVKEGREHGGT